MDKRKELESLKSEYESLTNQAQEYHDKAYVIESKSIDLISQIILEEEILTHSKWEIKIAGKNKPYLQYMGKADDELFVKLSALKLDDFQSSFPIEKGIDLGISDTINLDFDDPKQMSWIIKKLKIDINGFDQVKEALQKLRKEALVLEMFCHQLKLIA